MSSGYVNGKPDVAWWLGEIRKGEAFRKKCALEARWNTWRGYYRGQWPRGTIPVNLFFRFLRTVVPRIYFRNPSISVQPAKPGPEHAALAQLVERLDNKMIRSMRMKDQMKKIVQQTWMFGTGIGRRGFAQQFAVGAAPFSTDAPESGGQKVEYHSNVQAGMPWFLKVPTGNFVLPEGTCEFEEARWSAVWVRRPKWEVQNDPRLKHAKDINPGRERKGVLGADAGDDIDLVEIHDKARDTVIVLAPTLAKAVNFEEDRLARNNRPPFYRLVFNDDDEVAWGIPDSVILEPQQVEINEIRTLEMQHRRLSILKILYKKNSLDPVALQRLLNGTVAAGVEVAGELSDIDHFQVADVPNGLRIQGQEVLNDVREAMGFSRNQAGNFSDATSNPPTATEAQIVQVASEIRVDERRDMLADMLVDVFEDVNADIFDHWKDEQVTQVVGPAGIPVWVRFKPEMLKGGRYELQVDPDTSVPETKQVRMQKAVMTYNLLKPNPLIDPELLSKYLLHELHGVQFDNMLRQLQADAASGVPGSTAANPVSAEQYIRLVASAQAGK